MEIFNLHQLPSPLTSTRSTTNLHQVHHPPPPPPPPPPPNSTTSTTHPNPKRKKKEQKINWNWVWAQNNVGIKEKVVNGRPFFWQKTSGQMLREARQHQTHQNLFLRSKRRSMFDLVLYPTYPKSFKAIYHIYPSRLNPWPSECLPRLKCTPQQCRTQSWSYRGTFSVPLLYHILYILLVLFLFFWVEFWLWDGHVIYLFPTFIRDKDPTVNRGFLTKRKTNLVDNVARKKNKWSRSQPTLPLSSSAQPN